MTDAYADPLYAGDVSVGDAAPEVVVEDVGRQDIVKYAGASGDFNRIHCDEPYAREAGNPSVFAHGMFTAGIVAHAVADWFGLANVTRMRTRFEARVFPGDTVVAGGEVTDVSRAGDGSAVVEADLRARNGDGEVVISGDATAELPPRG